MSPFQVSEFNYFLTRVLISGYLTCWGWKFNLPWSFTILIIKPWAWSSAFSPLGVRDNILYILCQKTLELPQWLRLCAPNAGAPSSIPSQGTRLYMPQLWVGMPQLKILHMARKTWCSKILKKNLTCILHLKWVINPWPLSFNALLTHSKSHLIALVWQSHFTNAWDVTSGRAFPSTESYPASPLVKVLTACSSRPGANCPSLHQEWSSHCPADSR